MFITDKSHHLYHIGGIKQSMSYVSSDRNYTDNTQSGVTAKAERVGDITGETSYKQSN